MYSEITEPQNRLSKDTIKVWLIAGLIEDAIGFAVMGILLFLDYHFSWYEWIGWVLIGLTAIGLLFTIWTMIGPFLLYKTWRYDVSKEFLQLKFGAINEEHHLVPMTKIQSVATNQGPILRKFGLRSLTIITMGSSHIIPALPEAIALELRNQIAQYAKIQEVE